MPSATALPVGLSPSRCVSFHAAASQLTLSIKMGFAVVAGTDPGLNYLWLRLHLMWGMDVHQICRAMSAYLLLTSLVLQPTTLNYPFATRIAAHQPAHSPPQNTLSSKLFKPMNCLARNSPSPNLRSLALPAGCEALGPWAGCPIGLKRLHLRLITMYCIDRSAQSSCHYRALHQNLRAQT